jgi:cytochrome c553
MPPWNRAWIKRFAIWSCIALIVLGLGAFLFAASGLYSIAASRGHFAITEWILEFGMRRSVATHSAFIKAPPLQDQDMVRLGAGHFEGGCAPCHGAPGTPRNAIVRQMLPPPPDLAASVPTWSPERLFWIVQNGLKYTGMPAWVAPQRDDEVWALVAFLLALPQMDETAYRALVGGKQDRTPPAPEEWIGIGSGSAPLTACGRCHGDQAAAPTNSLVPKLAGQSPRYLVAAMEDYAAGLRPSGIMQPVAAELDAETIARLAEYYARRPADGATPPAARAPPEQIERGRRIATNGSTETAIPPCIACHVRGDAAIFPRLAGQHAAYTAGQLRLWRKGLRDRTARGAIMAAVAGRMTDRQIDDVAAYFEQFAPPASTLSQSNFDAPLREALP